jgi:hypothetical protein
MLEIGSTTNAPCTNGSHEKGTADIFGGWRWSAVRKKKGVFFMPSLPLSVPELNTVPSSLSKFEKKAKLTK